MGNIIDINSASLFAERKKKKQVPPADNISTDLLEKIEYSYKTEIQTKFESLKQCIKRFNQATRGVEMVNGLPGKGVPHIPNIIEFLEDPVNRKPGATSPVHCEYIRQYDKDKNTYTASIEMFAVQPNEYQIATLITKETDNGNLFVYGDNEWIQAEWMEVYGHSRMQHQLIQNGVPVSELVQAAQSSGKVFSDEEVFSWHTRYAPLLELYQVYEPNCCFAYTEREEGPFLLIPLSTRKIGTGIGIGEQGLTLYQFIPDFVVQYFRNGGHYDGVEPDYLETIGVIDEKTAEKIVAQQFPYNEYKDDDLIMYVPVSKKKFFPFYAPDVYAGGHSSTDDRKNLNQKESQTLNRFMHRFMDCVGIDIEDALETLNGLDDD